MSDRTTRIVSLLVIVACVAGSAGVAAATDRYADITGEELRRSLLDITGISLESRAAGDLAWGRIAGTRWDKQTADYIKARFEELGLDRVWQEEFPIGSPDVKWSAVSLTLVGGSSPAAPRHDVELATAAWTVPSRLTPPQGIEAAIVDVGEGTAEELARVDLDGKIALVHSKPSYMIFTHPGTDAIARIAAEGKAVGVVCTLHRPIPSNQRMAITNGPGGRVLPQINLGMGDGLYLSKVVQASPPGEPPRVRLVAAGERHTDWITQNTYGLLRGTGGEYVVIQAHTDGYFEAAGDNGTGLAVMLALARQFATRPRQALNRNLLFVATSGHHSGPAVGSWHLVKDHQEVLSKTVLVVNLEHLACVGPQVPYTGDNAFVQTPHLIYDPHGHPFMLQACREIAEQFGVPIYFERIFEEYQADMYPYLTVGPIGLPSFMLMQPLYDYHTQEDDLEKVSFGALRQVARGYAYLLDRIDRASVTEIRAGWKGRTPGSLPDRHNVLKLDLDQLRALPTLK